jgi:hypothetical protein
MVLVSRAAGPRDTRRSWSRRWSARSLSLIALACASFFGLCLTSYVAFVPGNPYKMQVLASAIKVPVLLVLGASVAFAIVLLLCRLARARIEGRALARPAFDCFVATSLSLAVLGPFVALLSILGNYSITIFVAYGAFSLAGLVGCLVFHGGLAQGRGPLTPSSRRAITFAWCLCFGLVSAEGGWLMRPFVGWRFGGIRFPGAGEASDTKQWSC